LHSTSDEYFNTRAVFEAFAKTIKDQEARKDLKRLAQGIAGLQAGILERNGGFSVTKTFSLDGPKASDMQDFMILDHHLWVLASQLVHEDDVSDSVHVDVWIDIDNSDDKNRDEAKSVYNSRSFSVSYLDSPLADNITIPEEGEKIHHLAVRLLGITQTDK